MRKLNHWFALNPSVSIQIAYNLAFSCSFCWHTVTVWPLSGLSRINIGTRGCLQVNWHGCVGRQQAGWQNGRGVFIKQSICHNLQENATSNHRQVTWHSWPHCNKLFETVIFWAHVEQLNKAAYKIKHRNFSRISTHRYMMMMKKL